MWEGTTTVFGTKTLEGKRKEEEEEERFWKANPGKVVSDAWEGGAPWRAFEDLFRWLGCWRCTPLSDGALDRVLG